MEEKCFGPLRFIPGENRGKYPYCHSIYIEDDGILIDPASDRKRLIELDKGCGVKEVWLSHWHEDHFMHLDLFEHLRLSISEDDAGPLESIEAFMDAYGFDKAFGDYWKSQFIEKFNFRPRRPDRFLKGDTSISLRSVTVDIISTPGHTPGHLSFFFKEPGVLLLGDYDLTPFGPWYADVRSSIEETIASVKLLQSIPAGVWIASHEKGVFMEEPGELWSNYLNVIQKREEKLLNLLEKPRSFKEIADACIIYRKPREPKEFYEFGERAHMEKHLKRLMKKGSVLKENNKYLVS